MRARYVYKTGGTGKAEGHYSLNRICVPVFLIFRRGGAGNRIAYSTWQHVIARAPHLLRGGIVWAAAGGRRTKTEKPLRPYLLTAWTSACNDIISSRLYLY